MSAPPPPTVEALLAEGRSRLATATFRPPPREAALLLARVLGLSEAQVMARGEHPVPEAAAARFRHLLARRLAGEPVAYLFGEREFYGRPFRVDRRVLIPRPETEHLVEAALGLALPAAPRILDVGTGSGILAVTLALEIPAARVVATDLSPGAVAVAAGNARRHGVGGRVRLVAADLVAGLELAGFDLVVSNPPYIAPAEAAELSPEITGWEPHLALFASDHGLAVVRRLLAAAAALRPGAEVLLEIGRGQAAELERAASASPLQFVTAWQDYSHIPRVVRLQRRPS
ncbi:MAG TPA: peptide chain release factor N(5)-glutamine methyltransferase [Thermoanaerobaculia bacterium]|nr:peptide chain release factor N(5)-glutamine methyltransferase [Thermoanaerobaculia bacterium]